MPELDTTASAAALSSAAVTGRRYLIIQSQPAISASLTAAAAALRTGGARPGDLRTTASSATLTVPSIIGRKKYLIQTVSATSASLTASAAVLETTGSGVFITYAPAISASLAASAPILSTPRPGKWVLTVAASSASLRAASAALHWNGIELPPPVGELPPLYAGLSVLIAGMERAASVHGLNWESTNQGDGGCSFWMEVADPFNPQASYPELLHGAAVEVVHTLAGVATKLYSGYVLTDPRAGYAGEQAIVEVECGGILEVAKGRTDMGYVFTDDDTSQWFPNKRNRKCFSVDTSDCVDLRVGDEVKVRHGEAGIVGYVPYQGADHLLAVMPGAKRITGQVSYDLHDNMKAALVWSPSYKVSRQLSDYTVIHQWDTNTKVENRQFGVGGAGYTFGGGSGAGYLALALWTDKAGGVKTTGERYVTLEYVDVYTDTVQKTVDQAMLAVANVVGLHTSASTATIGSVLPGLVARAYTDPASALATLSSQADRLVEWGFFCGEFRARPMLTDPVTIHGLSTCYEVDATSAEVVWNVTQHPEDGIPRSVRLLYGHTGKSTRWAAGSPAQVISSIAGEVNPGWTTGVPFHGTTAPVMTVDFTGRNYSDGRARDIAKALASHLGVALSGGAVELTGATVPVYGGGTRPTYYIHGGDWIECQQGKGGPLYITRAHVDADSGYVDLDVGLSEDLLIEQLEAAGNATKVPLHKPKRKKRR